MSGGRSSPLSTDLKPSKGSRPPTMRLRRRSRLRLYATGLALVLAALPLPVRAADGELAGLFARAVKEEQTAGAGAALETTLALLDRAIADRDGRLREPAVLAALDLLAERSVPALETLGSATALAHRHPGAFGRIFSHLDRAWQQATGEALEQDPQRVPHPPRPGSGEASSPAPHAFVRGAIARAAYALALRTGDTAAIGTWRGRSGCVRAAMVVGPLAWPPVLAAARPTALERPGARLSAAYPGVGPFVPAVVPRLVGAAGCDLNLHAQSALDGLRAVLVDVSLERPQRLAFELESRATATLVAGGKPVLVRPYHLGGSRVRSRGVAELPAGRTRLVARVGLNGEGPPIVLRILAEDGSPVATSAPKVGQSAPGTARSARAVPLSAGAPRDEEERALLAAAHLAQGDPRTAERLLEQVAAGHAGKATAPQPPLLALLYARAVHQADDLPETRALPLLRAAFAATLRGWPRAWEALAGQALLALRERGPVEGQVQALSEIAPARSRLGQLDPALVALQAALAARSELRDLAAAGLAEVSRLAPATPLAAQVDRIAGRRVGQEQESFLCSAPGLDRSSNDCLDARIGRGDRAGALSEIDRLRGIWDAPAAHLRTELLQRYALGETAAAAALYDRLAPAHRPVAMLSGLFAGDPAGLRARLVRDLPATADDPAAAMAALTTLLEKSPAPTWEAESARRVAEDRKAARTGGAATLVLAHRETYAIEANGLLRYTVYNLRRMSGTADVARVAQVGPQAVAGRHLRRSLRRRIFKPDGRVLDPETTQVGPQQNTELSQLEPGDYLEEIAEGFSLPRAMGEHVWLTQELLPARTSVQEATVEIRRPRKLAVQLWAHPSLGRPSVVQRGGDTVTTFSLRNAAPRRLETLVPSADREVAVYATTARWKDNGPRLAATIASLEDDDPLVSAWAEKLGGKQAIESVVAAVGETIKRANPGVLTDASWAPGGAQQTSARTMLELADGSRSWLAYRALRQLGVPVEIVVAEGSPFSADPAYPHRLGRFRHPLLVVRAARGKKDSKKDSDVWLDLDVRGPPLPPGRVSLQLRGRMAVDARGEIFPIPDRVTAAHTTEVSMDLKLDDKGTARGTVTVALRGRDAQFMADELPYRVGLNRDQRLRAVVLSWLPSATVNEVTLDSEEGAWQVLLKAGVELPGFGQQEDGGWTLPGLEPLHQIYSDPPVATLGATFAKHRARDSALAIEDAVQYRLHRRVELPVPGRLQANTPTLSLRAPHLEASRRVEMKGASAVVDEHFELSIPTAALDRKSYQRFVQAAARIDDLFQTPTRVGPVAAAP
jgi:hypothetical protein